MGSIEQPLKYATSLMEFLLRLQNKQKNKDENFSLPVWQSNLLPTLQGMFCASQGYGTVLKTILTDYLCDATGDFVHLKVAGKEFISSFSDFFFFFFFFFWSFLQCWIKLRALHVLCL
jgi:hypothetical protein